MRASLLLALSLVIVSPAAAQSVLVVVDGEGIPEAASRRWRARVEAALETAPVALATWARRSEPVGTVPESRLEVVSLIETLLLRARHSTARLLEREALESLLHAEALAERHLDIPGMAAWYAEVQLGIAITSAQAGQDGVSEAALRRAASVDPGRGVHAAEARPEVVARALSIAQAAATASVGRFEVRANAPEAVAFLDDVPVGALPHVIEAPVGTHVLRVDAPGHRSWAVVIDVLEGERPPMTVALAPSPRASAMRNVERAAHAGDLEALEGLLAEHPEAPLIWLVRPAAGPRDRALLYACRASGCAGPRLLEGAPTALDPDLPRELGPAAALRWLAEPEDTVVPEPEWYDRWYVWLAAGIVLAGAAAAAAGAGVADEQSRGPSPQVWTVDPSDLPVR